MKKLNYILGFLLLSCISISAIASNDSGVNSSETEIGNEVEGVKVYPNPFVSSITLELDWFSNETTTIRIFNIIGKEIFLKKYDPLINKLSINTDDFEKGIYFIEITKGNKIDTQRIIKR